MKTKNIVFLFVLFIINTIPLYIFADSPSTFPEEDAGIAVYAKLNGMDETNNVEKLTEAVAFLEENGEMEISEETYIIGRIPIEMKIPSTLENELSVVTHNPYVYIDLNGWIVVYFEKEEPVSKIINWNDYSPESLNQSVLEEALDVVAGGINLNYSDPKYYHFQYPEATRMSVIIDTVYNPDEENANNFSVTIPENIYDASYSLYYSRQLPSTNACIVSLEVDGETIYERGADRWCRGEAFDYGFYSLDTFSPNIPHSVVFDGRGGSLSTQIRTGAGTVLIYGDSTD
jgi:hypothetical protein